MALGSNTSKQKLVPQAYQALNQFKYEVAAELNQSEYKLATGVTFPQGNVVPSADTWSENDCPAEQELLRQQGAFTTQM